MTVYLKPFCDLEITRYPLAEPFNFGGYTCATDGRIAVRVPTDKPDSTPPPGKRFPKFDELGWTYDQFDQSWKPWPFPCYEKLDTAVDFDGDPVSDFRYPGHSEAFIRLETSCDLFCRIAIAYDILVRAFLPNPQFICDPKNDRVLIRFDGGEAILMALREDKKQ